MYVSKGVQIDGMVQLEGPRPSAGVVFGPAVAGRKTHTRHANIPKGLTIHAFGGRLHPHCENKERNCVATCEPFLLQ